MILLRNLLQVQTTGPQMTSRGGQLLVGLLTGALGGAALVFRRSLWVLYAKSYKGRQPRLMYFVSCLAVPAIWLVFGISATVAAIFWM